MKHSYLVALIILASLLLFAFVVPTWVNRVADLVHAPRVPVKPFALGLDLVGGAHLVYQADFSALEGINRASAMEGVRDVVERRVNYFGVAEPLVQTSGEDRLIVDIAGIKNVDEAIELIGQTPSLEFREQDQSGTTWRSTGLTGRDLENATIVFDPQTGRPEVSLKLNDEGARLFAQITKRNLGKPIAIFLDGEPISVPVVQSEITDGNAVISGNFSPQEAKLLATRLTSGALPVPINLISQQTIGASLGTQSLNDSLRAGVWGLILVAVFMLVLYRFSGLTSLAALGVYLLITLAIYKLLPITLTLAGIAGFILSLGMALDANVLIFARMKEELAAGRPLSAAMSEGFRRSWPSIRDSHVTTFISAFILYVFTTSLVRGFALTLGIGVVISLFTSTVVTRTFLRTAVASRLGRYHYLFA